MKIKGGQMSNITDKKEGMFICERLFVDLNMSIEECAKTVGVSSKTVYKWIKIGNWHEKKRVKRKRLIIWSISI